MKLQLPDPLSLIPYIPFAAVLNLLVERYGSRLLDWLEGKVRRKPLPRAERRRREMLDIVSCF